MTTLTAVASEGPPAVTIGAARAGDTIDGIAYDSKSFTVTDHHDGAYTVVQYLSYGATSTWFVSPNDLDIAYLVSRESRPMRHSGGVQMISPTMVSVYGKVFTAATPLTTATEKTASDNAWSWAATSGASSSPHGHPVDTVFDFVTDKELDSGDAAKVDYIGDGQWKALRTVFEVPIS